MIVKSIELENAWGISKPIILEDLGIFNILIGKNNVGKSNIIKPFRWLKEHGQKHQRFDVGPEVVFDAGDNRLAIPTVRVRFRLTELDRERVIHDCNYGRIPDNYTKTVDDLLKDEVGFKLQYHKGEHPSYSLAYDCGPRHEDDFMKHRGVNDRTTHADFRGTCLSLYSQHLIPTIAKFICSKLYYVGGWRSLKPSASSPVETIAILKNWRDPPNKIEARRLTDKWERFSHLFRELTKIDDVEVRFQQGNENGLSLLSEKRLLCIDDCGDGLQHLLMVAYYLVADPEGILLIEEPETHLHPELQRNLINIIKRESKGQLFITTHSPVLLDTFNDSNIYRIERNPHQHVSKCLNSSDFRLTLDQLDVRPSDILQANCVIWVEGPTDRMFLKRCFELLNVKFLEGIHYQFAYYGGRVRSHFAFDQLEEQERIDVLKLCRHAIMVCDSDKKTEEDSIDATKERLQKECSDAGGFYWVTKGREIENYIPDVSLTKTVQRLTGKSDLKVSLGQFGDLHEVLKSLLADVENAHGLKNYGANKAKLMQEFLKDLELKDLDQYDLKQQIDKIIRLVREWSGEPAIVNTTGGSGNG